MSGSGISWAICKSAPRSRQITTPAPHHSVFYRPDALPAAQPAASRERGGNVHDVDVDTFVNIAFCCMYMCMNFDAVAWGKIDAYETKSKGSPYSITKRTVP